MAKKKTTTRRTKKAAPKSKSSKKKKTPAKTKIDRRKKIPNRSSKSSTLSEKNKIFVREYLDHYNATRAAIVAGYSEHTAAAQGSRLLRNVKIAKEIEKRYRKAEEKAEREYGIRKDKLIYRLSQMIDSHIGNVMDYNPHEDEIENTDEDGNPTAIRIGRPGIKLRDFAEIPEHVKRCVKKVSETQHGYSVQMESKQPAIETLLKVIGAFDGSSGDKGDRENREAVRRRLFEIMEKDGL